MKRVLLSAATALIASGPALAGSHDSYATVMLTGPAEAGFAALGSWEASLYVGAEEGEETAGRITDWVEVEDGAVGFSLPDDLREGREMPEGPDVYFRVRSMDDDYPSFDMVSPAFEMTEGGEVSMDMAITADH